MADDLPVNSLIRWLRIGRSKYHSWKSRYGKVNEHNAQVPRDHWLEDLEKRAIVTYAGEHPGEGYRRLTYMMMDAEIVAALQLSTSYQRYPAISRRSENPRTRGTGT